MKHGMRLILAAALALCLAPFVKADWGSQGGHIGPKTDALRSVTVTVDTNSVGEFGAGSALLGMKILGTAASAACAYYDAANSGGNTNANLIDEITEATSGAGSVQLWPKPFVLGTDLTIDVTTATCITYF